MDNYNMYYKMPKYLFDNDKYKNLSLNAKFLYSIMLSKLEESVNNNQLDENGYYIYFTVKDMSTKLRCSDPVSIKTKKELVTVGLMTEKRRLNEPNRIYVKRMM